MKKIFLLILLTTLAVIFSCSEETPTEPENRTPKITSITASPTSIKVNETTSLTCVATDADGDVLTITWATSEGSFPRGNNGSSITWKAPNIDGTYSIKVTVADAKKTIEEEINIVVSVSNSISGVIYQLNTDTTIANVLVEIGGKSTVSANDGSYKIEDIPSGETTLKATKDDYKVYEQSISISSDKTTEKDIYLTGSILFSGHVTDVETGEAISGAVITIGDKIDSSDVSGYYQFENFAPGNYNVIVEDNNYLPFQVNINLSSNSKTLDIEIEYAFTNLSGVVKDKETSDLLSNVEIGINGEVDSTDENGAYKFLRIEKGTYTITAKGLNNTPFTKEIVLDSKEMQYNILLDNSCSGISTVTYQDKTYNTVSIGSQCWFKENLNVGKRINGSSNQTQTDMDIEKYCYNNDESNCDTYGGLYQWNEAMQYVTTEGTQGICPSGWHIPTKAEWKTLKTTVGNSGNALKAIGQGSEGGAGTNTSNFSALLAGYRNYYTTFTNLSNNAYFHSSTESGSDASHYMRLDYSNSGSGFYDTGKTLGFSVRCLKN